MSTFWIIVMYIYVGITILFLAWVLIQAILYSIDRHREVKKIERRIEARRKAREE